MLYTQHILFISTTTKKPGVLMKGEVKAQRSERSMMIPILVPTLTMITVFTEMERGKFCYCKQIRECFNLYNQYRY